MRFWGGVVGFMCMKRWGKKIWIFCDHSMAGFAGGLELREREGPREDGGELLESLKCGLRGTFVDVERSTTHLDVTLERPRRPLVNAFF